MNRFTLAFVALVAAAAPAYADPITAAATWLATATGIGVATAVAAVNLAVGFAVSAIGSFIAGKQIPGGQTKVQFDVQMGDDQPLRFVTGDYVTAGQRKFIGSTGPNTRDIVEVIEVSALPQGFDEFWVNDEVGEVDTSQTIIRRGNNVGWPVFNNKAEDGSPQIWMKWYDGTQAAADPYLIAAFGDDEDYPWTAEMVGKGKTYVIMTTCYNDETQTSYPKFLFKPAPLAVYDLRFDSTNGGSGPQRWNNPATWQPSTNPAVIAYNIIRGIYYGDEWVWGGNNMAAWRLPQAEWIAAANECDAPITLANGNTEPAYRCGLEVLVSQVPADVLEEIGRAANMRFAEVGGAIKPIVGIAGTSALSFTDDSVLITEGQSFKPFYSIADTYNALSATYPEPGENWTNKDAKEYINQEALEEDGGRYLPTSISYPAAPYGKQVQRLMRAQMRDFRRMRRHQFFLPPEAYALEPGVDTVSWTSQRNGYINKRFLVESVSKTPGMNVLVSLREVNPADYDWSSDFEAPITIVTPKRKPPFVQPINGLTVTPAVLTDESGNTRAPAIRVACDGDETGVTNIQIQARVSGDTVPVIDTLRRFSEPFEWYLRNVLPAVTYEVRARLISDLTPKSAWSLWYAVTTPDIRLGPLDVNVEQIKDEVREDLAYYDEWMDGTAQNLRDVWDEINEVTAQAADLQLGNVLARDQLQRGLAVEVGSAKASFNESIQAVVTDQAAIARKQTSLTAQFNSSVASFNEDILLLSTAQQAAAIRTSELEASLAVTDGDVSAVNARVATEEIARAQADSALGSRIDTAEASIDDAVASATQALVSRVEETEDGLSAQADAITLVEAKTDRGTASGQLRVSAESSPSGVQSRIGLRAEVDANDQSHSAAMYLDAKSDGTTQAVFDVDRFAIATGNGPAATKAIPFLVDGGQVYIDDARIRDAAITTAKIDNLAVDTIKIRDAAVTKFTEALNWDGVATDNTSSSALVTSLSWNDPTRHLMGAEIEFRPKATNGGADHLRVFVELDGEQQLYNTNGSTGSPLASGLYITNDATSSSDGIIRRFSLPVKWYSGGAHTLQLRFVTTGNTGRLGGSITMARWVK